MVGTMCKVVIVVEEEYDQVDQIYPDISRTLMQIICTVKTECQNLVATLELLMSWAEHKPTYER
jgi:predicted ATP-grasp superfamily ATP-dependent carboligase